jgi:hypothetical protein
MTQDVLFSLPQVVNKDHSRSNTLSSTVTYSVLLVSRADLLTLWLRQHFREMMA